MPSDRAVRGGAFVFALFFAVVVALGYIPGLNATPHVHHTGMPMEPGSHTMLGLYTISLLDDVTHGLSALLFLVAALHSARASRLRPGTWASQMIRPGTMSMTKKAVPMTLSSSQRP